LLISRLRTAAVLLAILFGIFYLDVTMPLAGVPGLWMMPIYLLLCIGTAREAASIVKNAWQIPVFWSPGIVLASAALPAIPELLRSVGWTEAQSQISGVTERLAIVCLGNWFLASLMGFLAIRGYKDKHEAIGWLVSLGLLLYVSVSMSFWWILRQIGDQQVAVLQVIGIAMATKVADAGAYFAGKNFGRTHLAPVLSPKKTWEGLLGGWVAACLAAVIYSMLVLRTAQASPDWSRVAGAVLLGTALTWFGLLGDLIESMMKRSGAIKDSGAIFAGLGGVWDVTDSLIPAGVVGLVAVLLGWI